MRANNGQRTPWHEPWRGQPDRAGRAIFLVVEPRSDWPRYV